MTQHRELRTVAISESTLDELFALKHAFEGEIYPDDEEYAFNDELVAMMLGYHLRNIERAPEKLARIAMQVLIGRMQMLRRDEAFARRLKQRRGIAEGVARPGFMLEANGLDTDTLDVLAARSGLVQEFAAIALAIMKSPAVVSTTNAIMAILRFYTDQQIIDIVAWSSFAHPLNGEVLTNEYPEHIEDEIRARVRGEAKRLPLEKETTPRYGT